VIRSECCVILSYITIYGTFCLTVIYCTENTEISHGEVFSSAYDDHDARDDHAVH